MKPRRWREGGWSCEVSLERLEIKVEIEQGPPEGPGIRTPPRNCHPIGGFDRHTKWQKRN